MGSHRRVTRVASAVVVGSVLAINQVTAAMAGSPGTTGGVAPNVESKSTVVHDPNWVALKESGRLVLDSSGQPTIAAVSAMPATSTSSVLDSSVSGKIVEPQGSLYDDHHNAESDQNYWNFCTAGAAAATLAYWPNTYQHVTTWPAGNFTEPYGPHLQTTWWASSDTGTSSDTSNGYATKGRAYLMYLAEQVKPPDYATKGIVGFTYYPSHGGTLPDVADALN